MTHANSLLRHATETLLFIALTTTARADNVIMNGSFEDWSGGLPVGWTVEGDAGVVQTPTRDNGVTTGYSARLTSTRFERKTRDSFATLAQTDFARLQESRPPTPPASPSNCASTPRIRQTSTTFPSPYQFCSERTTRPLSRRPSLSTLV